MKRWLCESKRYTVYQEKRIQVEEKNGSRILKLNSNMEELKDYKTQNTAENKKLLKKSGQPGENSRICIKNDH